MKNLRMVALLRVGMTTATLIGVLLAALILSRTVQAQSGHGQEIFLPLVMGGAGQVVTVTPTPENNGLPVTDGVCPAGTHLMHVSGLAGLVDPEEFQPDVQGWDGYGCFPDETTDAISCGAHGAASVIDGVAVCSCEEGFVGAQCQLPAPVVEKPAAMVTGLQQSLAYGDLVQLRATSTDPVGAADVTGGRWRVEQGNACLQTTRDAADCVDEVTTGAAAGPFLLAKDLGHPEKMAVISFTPDCCTETPAVNTVLVQPPGYIPVNGYGRPQLEPVLDAMEGFMASRCVGAGVIGIAHYGNPVGVWGLGKVHGRASSTIFNPDCPGDDVDPHYPQAPNVTYDMPFKIGSVSKTVSYAITRWVMKNRLQAWDTDVAIVSLSNQRVVSAVRTTDNLLRLDTWQVNGAGVVDHLGESTGPSVRDFALAAVGTEQFVAATRTVDNELNLSVWTVNGQGAPLLSGETTVSGVKQVRVVAITKQRVVTAIKLTDDRFRLMTWEIPANGAPNMLAQDTAGRVRDFDMVSAANASSPRVVAGVRTDNHSLKLIAWEIAGNGALSRVGEISRVGYIHGVKVAALTDSRLAVAVRTAENALNVMAFDISNANDFTKLDDDEAGVTDIMALSRIGPSGFAVVVRSQNSALKVITWVIDGGQLVRRDSDTAGPTSGLAATNLIYGSDTFNSILFVAARTAQSTLKIIPWNVTGPTPIRLDNAADGAPIKDYSWSDDDIEELRLLGYDIPEGLLPDRLERLLSQKETLPAFDPPIGDASDKSGTTGQIETCTALGNSADSQWLEVQLKHVFGHRTGLPRSAISYNTVVRDYLDELRGLDSPADYAAQELLLRTDPNVGNANVETGRSVLGWDTLFQADGSAAGYFVPQATLEEILLAVAGRCLPHPLGEYTYSNTDPGFTRLIMEHLTGATYAADKGYPAQHAGSILEQFFASELALTTGATDNIFAGAVAVESGSDMPEPGPSARDWDADATGTAKIYSQGWDRKRPHCIMEGDDCTFNAWVTPSSTSTDPARQGRVNWYWAQAPVNLPYWTSGGGAATGGLRAEALPFLKFMKNYWMGSYASNPSIGEPRANTWTLTRSHNGSLGGGYAYAIQLGNGGGCSAAAGVDIFVAVNQNTDKTGQAYNQLYNIVRNAACGVNWDQVEPYPFVFIADIDP